MKEIGFREKESCFGEYDMELAIRDRCNGTAIEDGTEIKLPEKDVFLVKVSINLDASSWGLSRSGRVLPNDGVDDESLKPQLDDFCFSSGEGSEGSSLIQRL